MAATWTAAKSTGRADVVYLLEILGIGVFSTYDYTPTDSWFVNHAYTGSRYWPYLQWDVSPIGEQIDYLEARLDVDDLVVKIADVGATVTGLVKDWKARTATPLTATLTAAATTVNVSDTSDFSASGHIYIGTEVIEYASKGGGGVTFEGCTRASLGTVAREHFVDFTGDLPEGPVVVDGPEFLEGRRAFLHAAVIDPSTGVPSATEIVYRGRVGASMQVGRGELTLTIEHISKVLKDNCAQDFAQSPIKRGYYYTGVSDSWQVSTTRVWVSHEAGTLETGEFQASEGWYTPEELATEINTQVVAMGLGADFYCIHEGAGRYAVRCEVPTNRRINIAVYAGSPLWALGFDEGQITSALSTDLYYQASRPPRHCVVDFSGRWRGGYRPLIKVEDATVFTANLFVQIPKGPFAKVETATGTLVTLFGDSYDQAFGSVQQPFWAVEDAQDAILRHCMVFTSNDVDVSLLNALKMMLGLQQGLHGADEPERWCAMGALDAGHEHDADFDWGELSILLARVSPHLAYWRDCLNESIEPWAVIGQMFAVLGICPRITASGQIGWTQLQTPIATLADDVLVDDSVWSLVDAAQVRARLGGQAKINVVEVQTSHDYTQESGGGSGGGSQGSSGKKGWGPPIRIEWREGINRLTKTRAAKHQLRGIIGGLSAGRGPTLLELAQTLDLAIRPTHFGVFGRTVSYVDIPCTWTARQLLCGDAVSVTHDLVPDTVEGTVGVTSRVGLVVGRRMQLTQDDTDTLTILFGADTNSYGIAPCALGTSYVGGVTKTVTFANADSPVYEQAGANDLDRFADGDDVLFIEYDTLAPTIWSGTISTVDAAAKTVVLTSDIFVASFPANGAWMVNPDWDNASATQQGYAYNSDTGTTPSLGAGSDQYMEWTV